VVISFLAGVVVGVLGILALAWVTPAKPIAKTASNSSRECLRRSVTAYIS